MLGFIKLCDGSFHRSFSNVGTYLHLNTRLRRQAFAFVFGAMCAWTGPRPAASQPTTPSPELSEPAEGNPGGAPSADEAAQARLDRLEKKRDQLDRTRDKLDHGRSTKRLVKYDRLILALDRKIAHERKRLGPSSEGPEMSDADFKKLQKLEANRITLERQRLALERRKTPNDSRRLTKLDRQIDRLDRQIHGLTNDKGTKSGATTNAGTGAEPGTNPDGNPPGATSASAPPQPPTAGTKSGTGTNSDTAAKNPAPAPKAVTSTSAGAKSEANTVVNPVVNSGGKIDHRSNAGVDAKVKFKIEPKPQATTVQPVPPATKQTTGNAALASKPVIRPMSEPRPVVGTTLRSNSVMDRLTGDGQLQSKSQTATGGKPAAPMKAGGAPALAGAGAKAMPSRSTTTTDTRVNYGACSGCGGTPRNQQPR
jgi:hypothetical protein